jgi:Trk K+ transport system NAD-binding subunit
METFDRPSSPEVQALPHIAPRCVLLGDETGDSRLAVAVASELIERGATVVIVAGRNDADRGRLASAVERNLELERCRFKTPREAAEVIRERLEVTPLAGERDLETALREKPASLADARCLLALSEDREQNLRVALIGHRVSAEVPVVLRAFDPDLAEEFESERTNERLNVRRAYSVAHLSAPSFAAGALLGKGSRHMLTMRAGLEYASVCRLRVASAGDRDPRPRSRYCKSRGVLDRTPEQIAQEDGCQILAWRRGDGGWCSADSVPDARALEPGDEVVVGGPLNAVLELARGRPATRRDRRRAAAEDGHGQDGVTERGRYGLPVWSGLASRPGSPTLRLRRLIADLARWSRVSRTISHTTTARLLVVMGVMVTLASIAVTPGHRPSDLLYQWASTALGNPTDVSVGGVPEKIMAALGLLAGGVALGLGTSLMSTALIQRRMMEGMRRRARRLKHHVIIVGLGDLGARVAARLRDVGIPCAVVEPCAGGGALQLSANPAFEAVAEHSPVLIGELGETLERARVDRADALIACSNNNLVNIEACMRAKRRHDRKSIRTIARIFDDVDARQAAEELGVDKQIAAVKEVAPAFADAALEDLPTRTIELAREELSGGAAHSENGKGPVRLAAVKWPGTRRVSGDELTAWHEDGIRVLGLWRNGERRSRHVRPDAVKLGDVAVLAGPRAAIARVAAELPHAADNPSTP